MYVALGAFAASLLALAILPAIWRRAVQLTRRRIEATVPLDVEEIRAEKDRMRAEFALTIRRMEKKLEAQRDSATQRRIEINQQSEHMHALSAERDAKADAVFELEERERVLRAELRSREEELVRTASKLREAERKVISRDNEIAILKGGAPKVNSAFDFLADERDDADEISLEELDAKTLRKEYKTVRQEFKAAVLQIASLKNELESTHSALDESKRTIEALRARNAGDDGETDDTLARQAEGVRQLESRIVELEAKRVESEAEITRLTIALEHAGGAMPTHFDDQTSAQSELEAQLARITEERDRLIVENEDLKQRGDDAGMDGDNAALRQKISEIAADIASMAAMDGGSRPPHHSQANGDDRP